MTDLRELPAETTGAGYAGRERIIAKAGFNRWMVPPAALCIHLCIGMAYGFSKFSGSRLRTCSSGLTEKRPIVLGRCDDLFGEGCRHANGTDGDGLQLEPIRSWLDVHLVLRAAGGLGGDLGWIGWSARDRAKRGSLQLSAGAAACCSRRLAFICTSFRIMWLGSGVIGGIGLGLGYISPGVDAD